MTQGQEQPLNVSSLVVQTAPDNLEKVLSLLGASGLCEVYFHDPSGRIVVTIEGRDTGEEMKKLEAIQRIESVLSADLAYSYSERESMEGLRAIDSVVDPVPASLKVS